LRPALLLLLVLPLLTLLPLRGLAMEEAGTLENDALRLQVSTETGAITHILDKHTNTDYVEDASHAKLFQLLLPTPDDLSRQINSWDQKPVSIEIADGVLALKFQNLLISQRKYIFQVGIKKSTEVRFPIDVTVTFRLQDEHIHASIEVQNHSLEEITDVVFPWLDALPSSSDGHPFDVILPSLAHKKLSGAPENPLGQRALDYPALLATSWLNYQTGSKGIGIEVRSTPETQEAVISLNPPGQAANRPTSGVRYIGWDFYPHIEGMSSWKSPPVVIHVHGTDWHAIAAEHREWYRGQRKPQRGTAFDQAAGFATYRLKKDDNTVNWTYNDLPKLAAISVKAGMQNLVIDGWRKREGPGNESPLAEIADPHLGGESRLKAVIEKLLADRVNLVFAFHPAYVNTAADHYQSLSIRWTVKSRRNVNQMQPAFTFYTVDYPYQDRIMHYWAVVDPSTRATAQLLHDAKRLKEEYGFRNLLLRGVGLQSYLSYNKEDVVPPQKVFEVGYEHFLNGLRTLFPDGLLLMEGFNDLVNPYGNGGYTWVQNTDAAVLAYSIPWAPFSNDVDALDYDQANESFARKILINLIVDGGDGTVEPYPEFADHLKALQSLKQATAPYYAQAEFRDHQGLKKIDADGQVVVSVFDNAADKKRGIVLSNLSEQPKKVAVEVELGPQSTEVLGHLFRLGGQRAEIELPRFSVDLAPYEVVVVGIDGQ